MTRLFITIATFGALAIALVLGVAWFFESPGEGRWEPAVNTLALLAGLTGIFAERWAAERERRDQAMDSIGLELGHNRVLLADKAFSPQNLGRIRVYPRLIAGAVDSAFASGSLSKWRDADLIEMLHRWRLAVYSFNQRLDLTERLMFEASPAEVAEFHQAMTRADGYLHGVREQLDRLIEGPFAGRRRGG